MANSGFDFDSQNEHVPLDSPWPNGAPLAVALTHDVDRVRKSYQYLTHLRTRQGWRNLPTALANSNPYWNFDKIMALEAKHGVKSTFYFLQESLPMAIWSPRRWALSFGKYKFDQDRVREAIQRLDSEGWEVGLHGSFGSFRNETLLRSEKDALEDVTGHPVEGIRQHYLNLQAPHTWVLQRRVGFGYDSSLGFRDRVGFEGLPKLPFSPFRDRFLVLPLALMDGALFSVARTEGQIDKLIRRIVAQAAAAHALLVVLWHQRFLNPSEFPSHFRAYETLLTWAKSEGAWMATAGQVAGWWREQGSGPA